MKSKSDNKSFKLNIFVLISLTVMFALNTFVLEPIFVFLDSDVTINAIFTKIIETLLNLSEDIIFAICYASVIYAAVVKGTKKAVGVFGIYCVACAVRRLCVLGITYLTYSNIDYDDIASIFTALIYECLLALVIMLVSIFVGKRYQAYTLQKKKAAKVTGGCVSDAHKDFTRAFSNKNPLHICALISGVILSAIRLSMRLVSDIRYNKVYGAPSSVGEILIVIVYYLSDILVCAIVYALSWLLFTKFIEKDTKTEAAE